MPKFGGQLAGWHHASGNDILGTNDILWEARMMLLPSQCSPPLPTSGPEALPGGEMMLLQQVAKGSQSQWAVSGGRDAEWKLLSFRRQKGPLESLDIMSSCLGLCQASLFLLWSSRNDSELTCSCSSWGTAMRSQGKRWAGTEVPGQATRAKVCPLTELLILIFE